MLDADAAEVSARRQEQPTMEAILSHQRILPAIAAFAVGIAVSSLIYTPFGLLAAFYEGEARDAAAMWAAFFALAICIGALIATRTSASPGAQAMPAAIRSPTREEPPSYPAFGPASKEKTAPRDSPIVSVAAADDQATAAQMVAASFWGGTPFHLRYWRRLTDGSHRWTEIRTERLHEPSGTQQWRGLRADIDDPKPGPP